MSYAAIAAALARDDLPVSERLVAFALASYANVEQLAWPGDRAAAVRAGLNKSDYVKARAGLIERGLLVRDESVARGLSMPLRLGFVAFGPLWEGSVNVRLLEAVLAYSRSRGAARLMLAVFEIWLDGLSLVDVDADGGLVLAAAIGGGGLLPAGRSYPGEPGSVGRAVLGRAGPSRSEGPVDDHDACEEAGWRS